MPSISIEEVPVELVQQFDVTPEELDMLMLDVSPVDAHNPTVMVATNTAKPKVQGLYGTVGLCDVFGSQPTYPESNRISPEFGASEVFTFKKPKFPYAQNDLIYDMGLSRNTVLEHPTHGQLLPDGKSFNYVPEKGYLGPDKAVFLVDGLLGQKIKVVQYIKVAKHEVRPPSPPKPAEELAAYRKTSCPRDSWLISGHSGIDSSASADKIAAAWRRSANLSALVASASQVLQGFTNLAGSAVGTTVGQGLTAQITLDSDAAGHGWYIDPPPTRAAPR